MIDSPIRAPPPPLSLPPVSPSTCLPVSVHYKTKSSSGTYHFLLFVFGDVSMFTDTEHSKIKMLTIISILKCNLVC